MSSIGRGLRRATAAWATFAACTAWANPSFVATGYPDYDIDMVSLRIDGDMTYYAVRETYSGRATVRGVVANCSRDLRAELPQGARASDPNVRFLPVRHDLRTGRDFDMACGNLIGKISAEGNAFAALERNWVDLPAETAGKAYLDMSSFAYNEDALNAVIKYEYPGKFNVAGIGGDSIVFDFIVDCEFETYTVGESVLFRRGMDAPVREVNLTNVPQAGNEKNLVAITHGLCARMKQDVEDKRLVQAAAEANAAASKNKKPAKPVSRSAAAQVKPKAVDNKPAATAVAPPATNLPNPF